MACRSCQVGRAEEILITAACGDQAQGSLHDLSSAAACVSITWLEFVQGGFGFLLLFFFSVSATVSLPVSLAEACCEMQQHYSTPLIHNFGENLMERSIVWVVLLYLL